MASDLANRLSKVADVPVASEDGLSRFICIPCKNKLMSGEYFRTTAKATYEKNKDPTLTASGSNSQVQITNKRTKDSSGPGASPQTRQCRPGAKRLTPEHPGRRLTYPDCDGLRKGLQAKYTITCFSGNGQCMRTNIVAIGTRPSFFLNFN